MRIVKLEEIAKVLKTGKTPPSKVKEYFEGSINWYTPGDLTETKTLSKSQRTITQLAIEENKATIFEPNTVLIGCIGDIGKVGITNEVCSSNQQLTGVTTTEDCDPHFFYYWVRGNQEYLRSLSNNAVVPILNNKTLKRAKLPLPPLETQRKIAAILDTADEYRQKTKALIEKYDALAQSLFLDMFGDPVRNPKGYNLKKLGEFGDFKNGMNYGKSESGVEIKCIGVGDFKSLTRIDDMETVGTISLNSLPSDDYMLKDGDLLFVRSNGNRALVGRCLAVFPNQGLVTYSGFCIRLRLRTTALIPMFLVYLFRTERFKQSMLEGGKGANIQNINQKILGSLEIPVPPLEDLEKFISRLQNLTEQRNATLESMISAEELFNSLLQKAFKGELA